MQTFQTLAAIGLALLAPAAMPQDYPSKPITMIVPFAPGGATDIAARVIAQEMASVSGQSVIVENREGAGGLVGANFVRNAAPDGYTILFAASGTLILAPVVNANADLDPVADFRVAGLTSEIISYFVGPADGPQTLQELVALGQADPAALSFGSAGVGTLSHIAPAAFAAHVGIEMEHIPYQGTSAALTDILAGRLSLLSDSASVVKGPISEGQVRPLAVLAHERTTALPDVPTMAEAGFGDFMALSDWNSWMGIMVPKATPDAEVESLNAIINAALESTAVQEWQANVNHQSIGGQSPAEGDAFLAKSVDNWRAILTDLGLAAQ